MHIRRSVALCAVVSLLIGAPLVFGQDAKRDQEKRSKEERQDIELLFKMLDEVEEGKQPAPSDVKVDWVRQYFARANDNKTYVPYTVSIDTGALDHKNAVILLRVVQSQGAETTAPAAAATTGRSEGGDQKVEYPWEDIYLVDLAPATNGTFTLNRAFQVDGGKYDIVMAVRERTAGRRNAPPAKASIIRRTIEVPDFNGADMTTSSLFLADELESVAAPPTPDEQRETPYTFGTLKIHPALDTEFNKSEQLNLWFWLYGVQPNPQKKPDVSVEFNFHTKTGEGEKFFNKTAPREFNPSTVPPQFEMAPGFGLPVEFSVPLATFPAGEYRLEIKATDKTSGKTLTRDVLFTVAG